MVILLIWLKIIEREKKKTNLKTNLKTNMIRNFVAIRLNYYTVISNRIQVT